MLRRYYRQDAVLLGEWTRALNRASGPCAICGRAARVTVWRSLQTGEVRCLKCFDAWTEQYKRDVAHGRRYA
jgi:hypothetical protein